MSYEYGGPNLSAHAMMKPDTGGEKQMSRIIAGIERNGVVVGAFENGSDIEFKDGELRVWTTIYGSLKCEGGRGGGGIARTVVYADGGTLAITGVMA